MAGLNGRRPARPARDRPALVRRLGTHPGRRLLPAPATTSHQHTRQPSQMTAPSRSTPDHYRPPATASTSFVLATLRALHMDPAASGHQTGQPSPERTLPQGRTLDHAHTPGTSSASSHCPGPDPVPSHWRTGGPYALADDNVRSSVAT